MVEPVIIKLTAAQLKTLAPLFAEVHKANELPGDERMAILGQAWDGDDNEQHPNCARFTLLTHNKYLAVMRAVKRGKNGK